MRNWAGNREYAARRILEPRSVEEVQELVRGSRSIRALGTRHAFSEVADTTGDLVSLRGLPRRMEVDAAAGTVTVDGGQTYGELVGPLDAAGWALHDLASLPHIAVAGACATGTHGSGDRLGNLATAVVGLELVTASGDIERVDGSSTDVRLAGAVVALGALGVVPSLSLRIEPAYAMRQEVREDVPFAAAFDQLGEILGAADAVSLFTDWAAPRFHQVWLKTRVDGPGRELPRALRDARPAEGERHPIPGLSAEACTPQLGVPGPWHERLPHFRLDHVPSAGAELQSESLVPRAEAASALAAVAPLADRLAPLVWVSEVRSIAADPLWLSPSFDRDSVAIHFTWKPDRAAVEPVMRAVERALEPFEPRPHWGKLFGIEPDRVRAAYPERPAFAALARRVDPNGTFRNAFVDRFVLDA
ncbi:MAG TPA: FAD-binding protein [Candidatus Limnocylindrales bacterium]|jgi:xylitol oxidase